MTEALRIDNLVKEYANGVRAVRDISFSVNTGDFFALLGPNGAGKSTTIGIVSSLINKTSGKVRIFDTDIDQNFSLAKRYLGVVPQEFNFASYEPIMEVLLNQAGYFGIDRITARKRAKYYLQRFGLWEKRDEPGRLLSGGMKRRLMIARALVHEPRLLILDEPTAGVDIELRYGMWEFIRELNDNGITIILTTHYLEEAESLCRNIAIIDHGKIVENTSMKKLLGKLQTETFVFDLGADLLPGFTLDGFTFRKLDSHTVEVDVSRDKPVNDVFAQFSRQGIQVLSMRNKANRLEQLFLDLIRSGRDPGLPDAELSDGEHPVS